MQYLDILEDLDNEMKIICYVQEHSVKRSFTWCFGALNTTHEIGKHFQWIAIKTNTVEYGERLRKVEKLYINSTSEPQRWKTRKICENVPSTQFPIWLFAVK